MGDLNSSLYTQRMVSQMFEGVTMSNGKPLLNNGLIISTDGIILWADTEEEMMEKLELFLFLRVSVSHKLDTVVYTRRSRSEKCELFVSETVYHGLKMTRQGITVGSVRIKGLLEVEQPKTVGDV